MLGLFNPYHGTWDARATEHWCSPQVWSLVTPALLPARHPCASPHTSPSQLAGSRALQPSALGAAETFLLSAYATHTSRNALASWYRWFLQLWNLKLQLLWIYWLQRVTWSHVKTMWKCWTLPGPSKQKNFKKPPKIKQQQHQQKEAKTPK